MNFSDPRLNISEFYRQTPRETTTDAVPIFRNILERFASVFFIAFFLYKFSTTAKYVDKKQNNTFLNLKHSIYREGNTMCFPYAVIIIDPNAQT